MPHLENRDTKEGFLLAGGAYLIWGFLPLYLKLLHHIPAWEIVPHRILWSLPVAAVILWWQGLGAKLTSTMANPRMMTMALLTATIISINWGTYVWAVNADRVL